MIPGANFQIRFKALLLLIEQQPKKCVWFLSSISQHIVVVVVESIRFVYVCTALYHIGV